MPCNTIQLNKVNLDISTMSKDLLNVALLRMGCTHISIGEKTATFRIGKDNYSVSSGQLLSRASNVGEIADSVRCAYSDQVVRFVGAKLGWNVQATGVHAYNVIR